MVQPQTNQREIISRHEARILGRIRFYTGRICKYNHDSERYVSTGGCIECAHPKLTTASTLTPLEKFRAPNGRIIELITQDEAHRRRWPTFFTGVPCEQGHMCERNVKSGRCLQCMHPPKYGPDGFTGWWPFQPRPPLRVPPQLPLGMYTALAERVQAEIERIVQELLATAEIEIPEEPKLQAIHGTLHQHRPKLDDWNGLALWWPFPPSDRVIYGVDPPLLTQDVPWAQRDGRWYAVTRPEGKLVEIIPGVAPYDPDEGQRRSQADIEAILKRKP